MSWMVGSAVMQVQAPVIVVEAASLTLAIVVAITIYAAKTKTDFTVCGPVIFIISLIFLVVSIFVLIFGPRLNFVLTAIGAFFSSFYLIYDTQLILSGTCEGHRKF